MPRLPAVTLSVVFVALLSQAGCSPALNWRDVRAEPTALKALMPCKPDERSHDVPLGGRTLALHVLGCEAGNATFAILYGDVGDAALAGPTLAQWKAANVAQMRGTIARESAFQPQGARVLVESKLVAVNGQGPDGRKLDNEAAYFARGSHVFQAVIYGERIKAEAADTFFPGLRFE